MLNRRDLLNLAVSAGAASAIGPAVARSDETEAHQPFRVIDTNVSLFRWPFRRLPLDGTTALLEKLSGLGITQAWAGSFEGLLHRDISGVNQRLHDACRKSDRLIAIGSVNPTLPDWESDLEMCCDSFRMPGIRLHPNYHGYALDDPRFQDLLIAATAAGRFVQIAVAMEDTRTQHRLVRVADVDLSILPSTLKSIRGSRVQILNHRLRAPAIRQLADTPGVFFDTSRVDSTDGIPELVESVAAGRVMYGSHSPFLIPEAALIRVHESGRLDSDQLQAVYTQNADVFIRRTRR